MQIIIATQHESEQFKGSDAWKCVRHPRSHWASDTCRVVGAERAWACLDQGLNFSSEDEEKVYGTLPWERLLLFEAPVLVAALISGKDYFISVCSLLSLLLPSRLNINSGFCVDLLGDLLLALSLLSFPISPFQSTPSPLFTSTPTLLSVSSAGPHSLSLSPYLLYSTLPTHDRLCN